MEKYELRIFANKQAMYYGVFLGVFLVVKFFLDCYTSGVAGAFISGIMAVAVPIFAYRATLIFKINTGNSENLSFGIYLRFIIYLFFFSSMFLALAQYVYYQYINPDYIAQQVNALMEVLTPVQEYAELVDMLKTQISENGLPSASTIAVQTIWIYIFLGLILGLPIAALVNRKK